MKTALISGASRGIGAAIARRLSKDGFAVAIGYLNSEDSAQKLAEEICESGGKAQAYRLDITDSNSIDETLKAVERDFGQVDVLVNNAGIAEQILFTDISDESWKMMTDTNLGGVFRLTRAALPAMIGRKSGKIINIASIWGETGGSCEVHYSAAKAGIIGMTKALAKELGPSGINVNCVSPGVILTDMTSHFDSETMESLKDETPLGRIGKPEDIAAVVSFLASGDADFITGQNISVNGGMNI